VPGGNPGTVVCKYSSNSQVAVLVSLYPSGTSLQTITAIVPATTSISGLGNSAAYYGTEVYVSNSSSPTFSVIDQTGNLSLSQVEAMAHAILGS
jgi:mRNA-degrading endonuclease toxin of MazEF toxin-antitoxin module